MKKSLKRLWNRSGVILNAVIEVTDHSLMRLYDRWSFISYSAIIPKRIVLYPDVNEPFVYYMNIVPRGFLVLRRLEQYKFVVVTITLDEHRNYGDPLHIYNVHLRERQKEYKL